MERGLRVDEAILRRRSVRGFLAGEVPEALIRDAFKVAQRAPSNCNVQPWTPHVVSGASLADLKADFIAGRRARRTDRSGLSGGLRLHWRLSRATGRRGAPTLRRHRRRPRRSRWTKARLFAQFRCVRRPRMSPYVFMDSILRRARGRGRRDVCADADSPRWSPRGSPPVRKEALSFYPNIVRRRLGVAPEQKPPLWHRLRLRRPRTRRPMRPASGVRRSSRRRRSTAERLTFPPSLLRSGAACPAHAAASRDLRNRRPRRHSRRRGRDCVARIRGSLRGR